MKTVLVSLPDRKHKSNRNQCETPKSNKDFKLNRNRKVSNQADAFQQADALEQKCS